MTGLLREGENAIGALLADGWTPVSWGSTPSEPALTHYALGSVGEWLYRFVLGIEPEAGSAGFSRLALRPHPGGQLSWA